VVLLHLGDIFDRGLRCFQVCGYRGNGDRNLVQPVITLLVFGAHMLRAMGPAAIAKQLNMARSSVYRVLEGR
jgi:hypothetical protein